MEGNIMEQGELGPAQSDSLVTADSTAVDSDSSCEYVMVERGPVSHHQSLDCHHHGDSDTCQEAEPQQHQQPKPSHEAVSDVEDHEDSEPEFTELFPDSNDSQSDKQLSQDFEELAGDEHDDDSEHDDDVIEDKEIVKPRAVSMTSSDDFSVLSESDHEQASSSSFPLRSQTEVSKPLSALPSHLLHRQHSDSSDSDHSDFVKIGRGERRNPLLRLSTCSNASSVSSGSYHIIPDGVSYPHDYARARAAHRALSEMRYRHAYQDDDDRCESDISGVAIDTSDISSLSIGDLPLTAGNVVRSYKHRPNVSLNTALTTIALVSLFLAVGIGIGHFIGSVQEGRLRTRQLVNLHGIQDDYQICLERQKKLEDRLRAPSSKEESLLAEVHIWQQKFEQLVVEKSQLEEQIEQLHTQLTSDLQQASRQIASYQSLVTLLEQDLENLRVDGEKEKTFTQDQSCHGAMIPGQPDVGLGEKSEADVPASSLADLSVTMEPEEELPVSREPEEQLPVVMEPEEELPVAMEPEEGLPVAIEPEKELPVAMEPEEELPVAMEPEEELPVAMEPEEELPVAEESITHESESFGEEPAEVYETASHTKVTVPLDLAIQLHLKNQLRLMNRKLVLEKLRSDFWYKLYLNVTTSNSTTGRCYHNTSDDLELIAKVVEKWDLFKAMMRDTPSLAVLEENISWLMRMVGNQSYEVWDADVSPNSNYSSTSSENDGHSDILYHISMFYNETRNRVNHFGEKVKSTVNKVQNLSAGMEVKKYGGKVLKEVSRFGNSMVNGWKKLMSSVKSKIKEKLWQQPEQRSKTDGEGQRREKKKKGQQHEADSYYKVKETAHGKKDYLRETENGQVPPSQSTTGSFEQKPVHKQSSNHDYDYAEFWKMADYEPDDILLHGGFFEENNHKWQKHQKRFIKLHGRLQKLNEEMLLAMDDDDIEDLYDDLDDLEDGVEETVVPERLRTWLTCQTRWWKSRIHRKHRTEKLVLGCARHLMKWQLKALCKPHCPRWEKHCTDWLSLSGKISALCQGNIQGFQDHKHRSIPSSLTVNVDGLKSKFNKDHVSVPENVLGDEELLPDPDTNTAWYFAREAGDFDSSWYNERMAQREDKRHDASWFFHRLERDDPDSLWHFARANDRQTARAVKK